jgi:hypothetical protein
VAWMLHQEKEILDTVRQLAADTKLILHHLQDLEISQASCCKETQRKLNDLKGLIEQLLPGPAVSFTAEVTLNSQGESMPSPKKSVKAAGDLAVADNGTFTVALLFVDADGVPTAVPAGLAATYAASDATPGPSALTLAPSADTSSAAGSITQATIQALVAAGSPLPTGLTVSVSATWTGLSAPQNVVATPAIDVVAGPAGSFVAQDTTP